MSLSLDAAPGVHSPTSKMYAEIQTAFDHFNNALFDGKLPSCIVTLQRKNRTPAYFTFERFIDKETKKNIDEIALNPSYFAMQGIKDTMRNLVHQLAHCWQHHYGTPGRARYHNAEWGDRMEQIGLMPSETGRPGGSRVGDSMSEWVVEDGLFDKAFNELMTKQFTMRWLDRFPVSIEHLAQTLHQLPEEVQVALTEEDAKTYSIRVTEQEAKKPATPKYTCPICQFNVWGKPGLEGKIGCIECQTALKTQEELVNDGTLE